MKSIQLFFIVFALMLLSAALGLAAEQGDPEGTEKQAFFLKTGQDLVALCSLNKEHPLHDKAVAFCYGYVTGAMSFYGAIAEAPKMPKVICADREIPRSEMVAVFLDWAQIHPEHLVEPPIDTLVRSAVAKWPCGEK